MLRGWFALASVYLCLSCLFGVTSPKTPGCSRDLFNRIDNLIVIANKDGPKVLRLFSLLPLEDFTLCSERLIMTPKTHLNCSLYTPSPEDVKQNCPSSSMQCFAAEVKVLFVEWSINNVPGADSFKLSKKLEGVVEGLNKTESGCRQCEVCEMKQPLTFLKDLRRRIELMNYQYCPSRKRLSRHPFSSS